MFSLVQEKGCPFDQLIRKRFRHAVLTADRDWAMHHIDYQLEYDAVKSLANSRMLQALMIGLKDLQTSAEEGFSLTHFEVMN